MIRKRTQRRFAVWLGSIALGLALFAPSISRVLHASSANDVAMASAANDHARHPGRGHSGMPDHSSVPGHAGMRGHPGMPMNGDVCGYCTLMCHSPVLVAALAFIILPLPKAPWLTGFGDALAPIPALLERRSRGPPTA